LFVVERNAFVAMLWSPSADAALEMAEILVEAGISCLQVPQTVPGAMEVIAELVESFGDRVIIGAAAVLYPRAAEACVRAGAHYIMSPVLDVGIISRCNEAGVPVIAGALTPTEILTAWHAGADMVKVFPCGALGGASYIKALRAPLPHIKLIPAGGVSMQTAASYISAGATAVEVGDEDLVDLDALRGGRHQDIATDVRLFLDVVAQARALASADPTIPEGTT
jgi:2-dehydro-3-deoxyphosphogluconate aldolase/(4S)-4-hydroxy-2-oxoglutarate aldolase